jgi:G:T/U-mismatch repair DNA glycosylase
VAEEYTIEIHPEWDFDIPGMKTLILGNFPPHKKRWDYEFFYPNKQNNFWKVLAAINGKPLKEMRGVPAVIERKGIMKKLKTGVMNIAGKVKRKGHSARDTDIEIIEYNDVLNVIKRHPELETIIIAGYSAKNSTARKFLEYLNEHGIEYNPPVEIKAGATFEIFIKKRLIKCVIVNSTSTAFPIKLTALVDQFRPYITQHSGRA